MSNNELSTVTKKIEKGLKSAKKLIEVEEIGKPKLERVRIKKKM